MSIAGEKFADPRRGCPYHALVLPRSVPLAAFVVVAAACADGGGVHLLDSGPRRIDAAPPPVDAGPADAGTVGEDAVAPDGGECTVRGPLDPIGVSCAASTLTCLVGCMSDGACQRMCLVDDPSDGGCLNCVLVNGTSCAQRMGCQEAWDGYYCCVQAAGCFGMPMTQAQMCAAAACSAPFDAFRACAQPTQMACSSTQLMCFPAAG